MKKAILLFLTIISITSLLGCSRLSKEEKTFKETMQARGYNCVAESDSLIAEDAKGVRVTLKTSKDSESLFNTKKEELKSMYEGMAKVSETEAEEDGIKYFAINDSINADIIAQKGKHFLQIKYTLLYEAEVREIIKVLLK